MSDINFLPTSGPPRDQDKEPRAQKTEEDSALHVPPQAPAEKPRSSSAGEKPFLRVPQGEKSDAVLARLLSQKIETVEGIAAPAEASELLVPEKRAVPLRSEAAEEKMEAFAHTRVPGTRRRIMRVFLLLALLTFLAWIAVAAAARMKRAAMLVPMDANPEHLLIPYLTS